MSLKENKALVRRAYKLMNNRDFDTFFELLAPEYIEHLPSGDINLNQLKEYAKTFFIAFPDISFTIQHIIAESDKVAVLVRWEATHQGEYMGIPPTENKIDISVANIIKIKAGKWVEFWNVTDMRLVLQLGDIFPR